MMGAMTMGAMTMGAVMAPSVSVGFLEAWVVDLDAMGAVPRALLNLLEPGEEERSKRFRLGPDRRRHLVSRILLRLSLSRLVGGDPREWRFITGETGKVNLANLSGIPPVDFNISHSNSAVVVALSSSGQVGVDIESVSQSLTTIDGLFTPRELAFLEHQPAANRSCEALKLWTIKEAYSKLLGLGMNLDFSEFDVEDARGFLESHELKLRSGSYHLALAARSMAGRLPPAAIRVVDPLSLVL